MPAGGSGRRAGEPASQQATAALLACLPSNPVPPIVPPATTGCAATPTTATPTTHLVQPVVQPLFRHRHHAPAVCNNPTVPPQHPPCTALCTAPLPAPSPCPGCPAPEDWGRRARPGCPQRRCRKAGLVGAGHSVGRQVRWVHPWAPLQLPPPHTLLPQATPLVSLCGRRQPRSRRARAGWRARARAGCGCCQRASGLARVLRPPFCRSCWRALLLLLCRWGVGGRCPALPPKLRYFQLG